MEPEITKEQRMKEAARQKEREYVRGARGIRTQKGYDRLSELKSRIWWKMQLWLGMYYLIVITLFFGFPGASIGMYITFLGLMPLVGVLSYGYGAYVFVKEEWKIRDYKPLVEQKRPWIGHSGTMAPKEFSRLSREALHKELVEKSNEIAEAIKEAEGDEFAPIFSGN